MFPVDHPELARCAGIGRYHDRATCGERGKHPCVPFKAGASTDPQQLAAMFTGFPRNIGIACGPSGVVVVDEDVLGDFAKFAASVGETVPATFTVQTGRGQHFYYLAREGVEIGNVEGALKTFGVNIRGRGGYVVGPGSLHASGVLYTVLDDRDPAPVPDWLVTALSAPQRPVDGGFSDVPRGLAAVPPAVRGPRGKDHPGERHDVLVRYACSLRGRDVLIDEAEQLFKLVWQRCEQPPICDTPLPWDDAKTKLGDCYGRYPVEVHRPDPVPDSDAAPEDSSTGRRVVLTAASAIRPQRVKWAWLLRMALGTLALLGGREGSGKSTLAYWIAARLTRGELPGEHFGTPRAVLVCATEDSWAHTIIPRLIAAGADLDRVYRAEVISADEVHAGLILPRDIHRVEEAAAETGAAMLLLDPLMSRIDAHLDTHRDGELRQALEPVAALADRTGLLVLGLIHFNKTGSTDVLDRIMGSKAFVAVARSVSVVVPDPDDESGQRRLFGTPKNNMGRTDLPSLGFTIGSYELETDDGPTSVGQVVFGAETDVTVTEAMERIGEDPDVRTQRGEAKQWLREHLKERGGSADSAEVKQAARQAGHQERTLQRARKDLKVVSESVPGVQPYRTTWKLPDSDNSLWGGGIVVIDDIDAGRATSGLEVGTDISDNYVNRAMSPREVAQTPPTTGRRSEIPADCPSCQVPLDEPPATGCGCADLHGEVA